MLSYPFLTSVLLVLSRMLIFYFNIEKRINQVAHFKFVA